jgi:hypothetical protein
VQGRVDVARRAGEPEVHQALQRSGLGQLAGTAAGVGEVQVPVVVGVADRADEVCVHVEVGAAVVDEVDAQDADRRLDRRDVGDRAVHVDLQCRCRVRPGVVDLQVDLVAGRLVDRLDHQVRAHGELDAALGVEGGLRRVRPGADRHRDRQRLVEHVARDMHGDLEVLVAAVVGDLGLEVAGAVVAATEVDVGVLRQRRVVIRVLQVAVGEYLVEQVGEPQRAARAALHGGQRVGQLADRAEAGRPALDAVARAAEEAGDRLRVRVRRIRRGRDRPDGADGDRGDGCSDATTKHDPHPPSQNGRARRRRRRGVRKRPRLRLKQHPPRKTTRTYRRYKAV